jgi:hypothetical protein
MTKLKVKASTKGSATKASASKTSASKRSSPPAANGAALIVLGFDDRQKPCGARFNQDNPDLVAKAATSMGFKVYKTSNPDVAALAQKLPMGKLYANGRGFVPNIRQSLYSDLIVELAVELQAAVATNGDNDSLPAVRGLPRTWEEIAPGHLVIAQESLEYGWWEAIVIARKDDVFTLRFRDYPHLPKFARHRSAIALIWPPNEAPRPEGQAEQA